MSTSSAATSRRRLIAGLMIPVVIAFGVACKIYSGIGREWVNNWGPASAAYEWFFMLMAFVVFPNRNLIVRIAMTVFGATCAIEFLQLWQPDWLQIIRATLPGRFLLGTTFSWWDFPAYAVGCVFGVLLLRFVCENSARESHLRD